MRKIPKLFDFWQKKLFSQQKLNFSHFDASLEVQKGIFTKNVSFKRWSACHNLLEKYPNFLFFDKKNFFPAKPQNCCNMFCLPPVQASILAKSVPIKHSFKSLTLRDRNHNFLILQKKNFFPSKNRLFGT